MRRGPHLERHKKRIYRQFETLSRKQLQYFKLKFCWKTLGANTNIFAENIRRHSRHCFQVLRDEITAYWDRVQSFNFNCMRYLDRGWVVDTHYLHTHAHSLFLSAIKKTDNKGIIETKYARKPIPHA